MKNYTNIHSNETMYIMSETELREVKQKAVERHKERKRRARRRFIRWILIGLLKVLGVWAIALAIFLFFWCQIPPM